MVATEISPDQEMRLQALVEVRKFYASNPEVISPVPDDAVRAASTFFDFIKDGAVPLVTPPPGTIVYDAGQTL